MYHSQSQEKVRDHFSTIIYHKPNEIYFILGEAYGWGMGTNYQLGNGNEDDVYEPQLVTGKQIIGYKIIKVSSGGQHTVFLAQKRDS